MKKIILISIFTTSLVGMAQDEHFSQIGQTEMFLNPGNAGVQHDMRAVVNYRKQWSSFVSPFETMGFSFDMTTSKKRNTNGFVGVGLSALHDKAGSSRISSTKVNLNVSGALLLDDNNLLSLGLMGGFGQTSANFSALRWESQYDGSYNSNLGSGESFSDASFTYLDAGAGLVWSYGKTQSYITANDEVKANVGISAFHFGLPQQSFLGSEETKNTKFVLFGNAELGQKNSHLTFIPEVMIAVQGNQKNIVVGNNFRYLIKEGSRYTGFVKQSAISFGLHYRYMDAVITSAQLNWSNYAIAMSYDWNVSTLTEVSHLRGGFEVSLKFVTPNPFSYQGSRVKF